MSQLAYYNYIVKTELSILMNKIRISTLFGDIFDIQFFKYWMNIEKRRYNKVIKSKMFCNSNSDKTTKLDLFIEFIFRNPRNK